MSEAQRAAKPVDLMDRLIRALSILRTYLPPSVEGWDPIRCDLNVIYVKVDPKKVSPDDVAELEELTFRPDYRRGFFKSYRFQIYSPRGEETNG